MPNNQPGPSKDQCVSCGAPGVVPFENRTLPIACHQFVEQVEGLDGVECLKCGEIVFDEANNSAKRYSTAGDKAVFQYRSYFLKTLRERLKMTQAEMGELSGGGPNAISRYERGVTPIPTPFWHLLKIIDKDPGTIQELKKQ